MREKGVIMKKIILVDNHEEDIDLLVNLLNEYYVTFVEKYNAINGITKISAKNKPTIEGYRYDEYAEEENRIQGGVFHGSEDDFTCLLGEDSYCLIDLCLKQEEEFKFTSGNITNNEFDNLSGCKFVKNINIGKVSMITRFFISLKVDQKYVPVIAKPLYKNIRTNQLCIDTSEMAGNFYVTELPRELWTNRPDEGFCNMVFYKFFNKGETA